VEAVRQGRGRRRKGVKKINPAGNSGVLVLNPLKNYYSLLFAGLAAF
jgi:hypothetical protein